MGEVFEILGEAAIAAEPGEGSLDDPATRQDDKAFRMIASLDDFEPQHGDFGDGRIDLMGVVATVGPQKLEPRKAVADFVEHEGRAIVVLHPRRMDDDAHWQAFGIDERVDFAALHFLAGVIAYSAIMTAPFSADFKD